MRDSHSQVGEYWLHLPITSTYPSTEIGEGGPAAEAIWEMLTRSNADNSFVGPIERIAFGKDQYTRRKSSFFAKFLPTTSCH
jgi:hypothetical protein